MLALPIAILLSNMTHAAIAPGTDTAPWKAYATVGVFSTSGVVVVDSTHAKCVQRFQDAMDNYLANHGGKFDDIQYCHFNPAKVGIRMEDKLISDLRVLEETYSIEEYQLQKSKLFKAYETERSERTTQR